MLLDLSDCFLDGHEHHGGEIFGVSALAAKNMDECQAHCRTHAHCMYFVLHGTDCSLRSKYVRGSKPKDGTISGPAICPHGKIISIILDHFQIDNHYFLIQMPGSARGNQ